ncbi:ABC-2 type transport system ATP-binding protein [Frisingicoccus caecimuris]|uniref:ABC-2 type transport system ATP-binding protein n=1 Tax=Frisingicoccus caecimuris TaxID=1796636 RepID=A0A4R2LCJ7_9FIRM|nr:ABC-2 type transport system ATP-binding protein [Frisingicoccus caecimuris]
MTKQYGKKVAVNRLNLSLTKGVYGLLGANGAGKTTLMRLICGIQAPTSGKITLNDREMEVLGENYRKYLGYLPQQFPYYPDFSAMDYLLYIAALKDLDEKKAKEKSKELLETVGLTKNGRQKIRTFSGGMKQRLGIAQAMLNDPYILVLDEPTAGLDPKERVRFRNLISAFSKERIVILSTHIVSDVEFIAEKIIMMKSGSILHYGRPREITSEIRGKVWKCVVPAEKAEQYTARLNVSNLRNVDNNQTILRVISKEPPLNGALQVEPNLEDLYLYYFKGGNE